MEYIYSIYNKVYCHGNLLQGFFRRSLARQHELMCRQNAKCQLRPSKRSMCALCRFKKCLEIGMSVEGMRDLIYF